MIYDALVIGAGLGGLVCAAKLSRRGKKVLVLEKKPHPGGTSYVFRRGPDCFPMGPLAFSFPERAGEFLAEAGVADEIKFKRVHFELLTPSFDIVYSRGLRDLQAELARTFPHESDGIEAFLAELMALIPFLKDLDRWHPDFSLDPRSASPPGGGGAGRRCPLEFVETYSNLPASGLLDKYFRDARLKNFLGSQGTSAPEISLLQLAFMWNIMSESGIWFPSCGIHRLSELLRDAVLKSGGEVRLGAPVEKILIEGGRAKGIRTQSGEVIEGRWVISNADLKRTFVELIEPGHIRPDYRALIRNVPYTDSELCVYLGVDPAKVDLSRMRAGHLFFLKNGDGRGKDDPTDFDRREIEICLWSEYAADAAPSGRAVIVLRVGLPYALFDSWRTGEKRRRENYHQYRKTLAAKLISTAESALPGLASAVELMEVATPLTYRDWGQRYQGSIAGWTRSADLAAALPGKLLIKTPFPNLLMVGIYAAAELFLGGVPTSMFTASRAADYVLAQ